MQTIVDQQVQKIETVISQLTLKSTGGVIVGGTGGGAGGGSTPTSTSTAKDDSSTEVIPEIILSIYEATFTQGKTLQINIQLLPDELESNNIIWTSENEDVATVTAGHCEVIVYCNYT